MRRILEIPAARLMPTEADVLVQQGVPAGVDPGIESRRVAVDACRELEEAIAARGLLEPVSVDEFADIHRGEGANSARSPLQDIFPRAEALYLFAATCGPGISGRISGRFRTRDYAAAAALDAAASLAADRAAEYLERLAGADHPAHAAVRYSPGYCGWHVSGQRALFAVLEPGEIGVRLGDSCVMDPLKSVSGVIVVGDPRIHRFATDYEFCNACTDRSCRARIESLSH